MRTNKSEICREAGKLENEARFLCFSFEAELSLLCETLVMALKAFRCLEGAHHIMEDNLLCLMSMMVNINHV